MPSDSPTPDQLFDALPDDRKEPMKALRSAVLNNLPAGFAETVESGMVSYVVPLSVYPAGYHCSPETPLPFISLASQKRHIAVYHMGVYSDPDLLDWFQSTYANVMSTKLNMGKSCIRFTNPKTIPIELIGELAAKMTVDDWVSRYEQAIGR